MPRPIKLSLVLRVLKDEGFFFVSQKGSHAKFRKIGAMTATVIVKMSKKEIPYGTFQAIVEQSGLHEDKFVK